MSYITRRVEFPGALGDTLAARLELPDVRPRAFALFAHCFTCSKQTTAAVKISRALAKEGFAVLRFDFTGLGGSEGDFANTNFSSNVADLIAAAEFLREEYQAPSLLVGHSLGGAAVLMAAGEIDEVVAVSTIAAPCNAGHVEHLLAGDVDEIEEQGEAKVAIAGREFRIQLQFLQDIRDQDATRERISRLKRALLVFHGPFDDVVGVENAREIFQAAKHPKSFVSLDRADHLLSNPDDAEYVANVLAAWVHRYVGDDKARSTSEARPDVDGALVAERGTGKYLQDIWVHGHALTADEPRDLGGDDVGPSPYDLLLAALGACTNMTLRMYANRKEWPVTRLSTRLKHQKIHASDCDECETTTGRIDQIEKVIRIDGPLDDAQRARMMEIAEKCPVNRTLNAEVRILPTLDPESVGVEAQDQTPPDT